MYEGGAAGIAIANIEPSRKRDLYVDYRFRLPPMHITSRFGDPKNLNRSTILAKARAFADKQPDARFAVLRLWSAPHFYPLMYLVEDRAKFSFLDDRNRIWAWKFIPKDMPNSEVSIHQAANLRIEPWKDLLRDQVMVARDLFLVMGKDEKDLRKLSEGVTLAIQTKPWRLEVDLWRSFVNVELKFLEDLHEKWLE